MVTHKFKRYSAVSMMLGLTFALIPALSVGKSFTDVGSSTQYSKAIEALKEKGVISGYDNGSFKPTASINRAELLKIVLEGRGDPSAISGERCFPDVNTEWYASYVCTAKREGIVSGYPDGKFKPEQPVTFAEASKIFSNAYGQQVESYSPDWYEPYVRALEQSKAIPPSVNGLTKPLHRGEMAEMMWRLSEKKTDQPSKGYLNVKYPSTSVNFAADTVQKAKSCADLQAFVDEAKRQGGGSTMYYRNAMPLSAMPPSAGAARQKSISQEMSAADTAGGGGDGSYSKTNVQVEGVDEADIVKTDGTYLYVVSGNKVQIIKARPANDMRVVATISESGSEFRPSDLYIEGNRLTVIGMGYRRMPNPGGPTPMGMPKLRPEIYPPMPYFENRTEVRVYDVSDHASPKLDRTVTFEGNAVSSRRIGEKLYLVLNQPVWGVARPLLQTKAAENDVLPRYSDSTAGDVDRPVAKCANVSILPHVPSPEYLTVAVIPLDQANGEVKREVVLGNASNVYSSLKNLYVATTQWNYRWDMRMPETNEETNVYRFEFTSDGIAMRAQGKVPGRILNQFSMDENDATFRIATTIGHSWDSSKPSNSNLFVLNMDMQKAGELRELAPGEEIYSVRFMGDRVYMVTFQKVDPLFVIDTSDSRNPKVLGKLKIPGYSNYLHPYDATHIIGFGKDAVEAKEGNFAWYQGMKIALFDVTDVTNPKELAKTTIGDRGTDSPLLSNHKALLFDKERNLLSFPVTVYKIADNQKGTSEDQGNIYGSPVFQGAYVYKITLDGGFDLRGTITHQPEDVYTKAGGYWYGGLKNIERVLRIDDSLLTISGDEVQSHTLDTIEKEGEVEWKGEENGGRYYIE